MNVKEIKDSEMDRLLKYRKMHGLLKELGIERDKIALLEGYGVNHTNELTDDDLQHLMNRLVLMKEERTNFEDSEKKRWRSNVLTLCNKYGVYVTNNDWTQVNRLLLNKRVSGKLLYEMTKEELQETCLKLRIVLSKRKDKQDIEKDLALQN